MTDTKKTGQGTAPAAGGENPQTPQDQGKGQGTAPAAGGENKGSGENPPETPVFKTAEQRRAEQLDKNRVLKSDQLSGKEPEKIVANKNGKHKINKHEEGYMHLILGQKFHNPQTKSYDDKRKLVKVNPLQFQDMVRNRAFKAYDSVDIIHDPRPSEQVKAFDAEIASVEKKRKNLEGAK